MTAEAPARALPSLVMRALKEAAVTALLAGALFLPFIAFTTVPSMRNELVLETRWGLYLAVVAFIVLARFFYVVVLAPWMERRPAKPKAASTQMAHWQSALKTWFTPFALGFVTLYPVLVIFTSGWGGALKWI